MSLWELWTVGSKKAEDRGKMAEARCVCPLCPVPGPAASLEQVLSQDLLDD